MATAATETQDLVTCSICLEKFDSEKRVPKFLSCSHTACCPCLNNMCFNQLILCPLCRFPTPCINGVSGLPTNTFALHIIKLTERKETKLANHWCLACGQLAKENCISSHPIVMLASETPVTQNQFDKQLDTCKTNWAMAIGKRRDIQAHLKSVKSCLQIMEHEIDKLVEENDSNLARLISQMETIDNSRKPSLSEEEVKKLARESYAEIKEISKIHNEYKLQNSLQMTIQLFSNNKAIPSLPIFTEGFQTQFTSFDNSSLLSRQLGLLSFIVYRIINQQNVFLSAQVQKKKQDSQPNSPQVNNIKGAIEKTTTPPAVLLSPKTPNPNTATSIQKLPVISVQLERRSGKENLKLGSFCIEVSPHCNPNFLKELLQYCQGKSVSFEVGVPSACDKLFIEMEGFNIPSSLPPKKYIEGTKAKNAGEIGFTYCEVDGKLLSWGFLFLLQKYKETNMRPSYLFGRNTSNDLGPLIALSQRREWKKSGLNVVFNVVAPP